MSAVRHKLIPVVVGGAERQQAFLPSELRQRIIVKQWLYWQMAGFGPMGGHQWHFNRWAPRINAQGDHSCALRRLTNIWSGLWRLMDKRLSEVEFLGGDYSIADMACFPWTIYMEPEGGTQQYGNFERWIRTIAKRPAVKAAYARGLDVDMGYERNQLGTAIFPQEGLLRHVIVH